MTRYEIYDVPTEELLAEHDHLAAALICARYLANAIDACRDAQPDLDDLLHRTGPTRVAVHDARTGDLLIEITACTGRSIGTGSDDHPARSSDP
ncbi:MAG TPA: hypothetical protein VHV82_21295 [Sporichthyaceae bacterium]|jgi:hypothetical protein|nr:hypothetical protein [Sporichthyaceae bacterium]